MSLCHFVCAKFANSMIMLKSILNRVTSHFGWRQGLWAFWTPQYPLALHIGQYVDLSHAILSYSGPGGQLIWHQTFLSQTLQDTCLRNRNHIYCPKITVDETDSLIHFKLSNFPIGCSSFCTKSSCWDMVQKQRFRSQDLLLAELRTVYLSK